ncbi:tRNA(His) guanylyltransferase Thg1 family protein [Psychrobacter sp. I-STPA10]|uniref:tRNA(His) guanylyltransferase Thg1 family protein n=1 Tax=Psychrobacter sp. I-STPA10 TaxID=2585769 RepID=UPI001E3C5A3E|nr:tRNA(His) guanylyltransferase Thg1 family protein [Psychrobacter sp. I-STPA10]
MRFEELDKKLRVYETAYDLCIPPEVYLVVRLDGRGFTKKTKETWQLQAPFDIRFHEVMVKTCCHLMNCGFNVIYAYTQSDEISLLFHPDEDTFKRKQRKINSVLAGEASGFFSLTLGDLACFDARICQLPNKELVKDYFCWRQEDAHRNSLNAHCYWILRHQGVNATEATKQMAGKPLADKHELLFANQINFNDLPNWQKRGTGLYWAEVEKQGFNPMTEQSTTTTRREIVADEQLLLGEDYGQFIVRLLANNET